MISLEEKIWDRLITRADKKYGHDSEEGWENWVLRHWPSKLSFSYWHYLLFVWYENEPWINLWSPWSDIGEFVFWVKSGRWHPVFLFEETRIQRIRCRLRGHPKGPIYYNPGGYEPDWRCQECGEELG